VGQSPPEAAANCEFIVVFNVFLQKIKIYKVFKQKLCQYF